MRVFLSALALSAASVFACGPTIDVGQTDGGRASDGATSDLGEGGADAGMRSDSATTGSSKTKAGQSCEKADLPPAGNACSIPGVYTVTESMCSSTDPTCMDVQTTPDYVWTANVTISGTTVKLTNGTNRLMHCVLTPPCTCVSTSGDLFNFTSTGFAATGKSQCQGTAVQNQLTTGVKQ